RRMVFPRLMGTRAVFARIECIAGIHSERVFAATRAEHAIRRGRDAFVDADGRTGGNLAGEERELWGRNGRSAGAGFFSSPRQDADRGHYRAYFEIRFKERPER